MKIYKILISITVPIVLIMLFASLLTTKQYLYISEGLYESHEEIEFDHTFVSDRVMGYLNYRYDDLDIPSTPGGTDHVFRQLELDHMVDVKNLYTTLRLVALCSLIIAVSSTLLMYKKDKLEVVKTYKRLFYWPMFFIFVLGGFIIIDFGKAFTVFHQLFFTNDDWILRADDALIQLLPFNFWLTSASIILGLFALSLAIIHFVFKKIEWNMPS